MCEDRSRTAVQGAGERVGWQGDEDRGLQGTMETIIS